MRHYDLSYEGLKKIQEKIMMRKKSFTLAGWVVLVLLMSFSFLVGCPTDGEPEPGSPTVPSVVQLIETVTATNGLITVVFSEAPEVDPVYPDFVFKRYTSVDQLPGTLTVALNDGFTYDKATKTATFAFTPLTSGTNATVYYYIGVKRLGDAREVRTTTSFSAPAAALVKSETATATITGTVQVGQTLTVTTVGITPTGGFTYQWQQANAAGTTYTNITGATGSTYNPRTADVGYFIRCNVSSTVASGSIAVGPTATAVIAP